jgi:hypothetical protein
MKRFLILFCLIWFYHVNLSAQRHYTKQHRVDIEKNIKPQLPLPLGDQKSDHPIMQCEEGLIVIGTNIENDQETAEEGIMEESIIQSKSIKTSSSFSELVISHSKSRIKSHRFAQHKIPKGVRKTNDVISVLFWVFGILFSSALGGFIANVIVTGLSTITIIFLAMSIVFLLAMVALIIISVLIT